MPRVPTDLCVRCGAFGKVAPSGLCPKYIKKLIPFLEVYT